jgi:nitrite reductase/ring-hydroxylating ferredoxin subunit
VTQPFIDKKIAAPTRRVRAGRLEDLPPGSKTLLRDYLENILLVNVAGKFFAVSNTCPHAGGWMVYGPLEGYILECPMHFWPFDLRTGCLVGMEATGIDERLNTYPVIIEAGEVFVELPAGS